MILTKTNDLDYIFVPPIEELLNSSLEPCFYSLNSSLKPCFYSLNPSIEPRVYSLNSSIEPWVSSLNSSLEPCFYFLKSSLEPCFYSLKPSHEPYVYSPSLEPCFYSLKSSLEPCVYSPKSSVISEFSAVSVKILNVGSWNPRYGNPSHTSIYLLQGLPRILRNTRNQRKWARGWFYGKNIQHNHKTHRRNRFCS